MTRVPKLIADSYKWERLVHRWATILTCHFLGLPIGRTDASREYTRRRGDLGFPELIFSIKKDWIKK